MGNTMDNTKTWDVIVARDVMVPMRDGVHLATDLYVPAENRRPLEQKLPAVLQRNPKVMMVSYFRLRFEGLCRLRLSHIFRRHLTRKMWVQQPEKWHPILWVYF